MTLTGVRAATGPGARSGGRLLTVRLHRSRDFRSADPRAVARRFDRTVARWMTGADEAVQFVGVAHSEATYAKWRRAQLARLPGAFVPVLPPGRWPLVLWAMPPQDLARFVQSGEARGLYTAPEVGIFEPAVVRATALAAVIAGYLEKRQQLYRIAPPLLGAIVNDRLRVQFAPLDRHDWTLPPAKAPGLPVYD